MNTEFRTTQHKPETNNKQSTNKVGETATNTRRLALWYTLFTLHCGFIRTRDWYSPHESNMVINSMNEWAQENVHNVKTKNKKRATYVRFVDWYIYIYTIYLYIVYMERIRTAMWYERQSVEYWTTGGNVRSLAIRRRFSFVCAISR